MLTNNTEFGKGVYYAKTRFQNVIFTLIMAFVMVYAMICYNINLHEKRKSFRCKKPLDT